MWLAAVRDIAIVLLAIESLVIGALLAIMLVQLRKLMRMLHEEVAPLLQETRDTVGTVHGTVDFVSTNVVTPLIRVRSFTAGTTEALRSLLFLGQLGRRGRDGSDDH